MSAPNGRRGLGRPPLSAIRAELLAIDATNREADRLRRQIAGLETQLRAEEADVLTTSEKSLARQRLDKLKMDLIKLLERACDRGTRFSTEYTYATEDEDEDEDEN